MTAPASIAATVAAPVVRAAMGDTVGAAVSGFEAILALLGGSPQDAAPGKAAANDDADETATDAAATDPSSTNAGMAGWLARFGDTPILAQTLSQADGEGASSSGGAATAACGLPSLKSMIDGAVDTAGDIAGALLGKQQGDAKVDTSLLDQLAAKPGQTATEALQNLASNAVQTAAAAVDQDGALAKVAAALTGDSGQTASASAGATDAAAALAAPMPAMPALDAKAAASKKTGSNLAAAADIKGAKTDKPGVGDALSTVEAAKVAAEEPGAELAPVESEAARDAAEPAPATASAETHENIAQTISAKLESLSAAATSLAAQVRGAPETVAKLAAGIVDRLSGQSTRFDMQLDPHGLGKVDVSVEIGKDGRLTAQLGFDTAQAAGELRGRAQELRSALEQAGFTLTDSSLSFDFTGQNSRQDGQSTASDTGRAGRAFAQALGALDDETAAPIRFQTRRGLDISI